MKRYLHLTLVLIAILALPMCAAAQTLYIDADFENTAVGPLTTSPTLDISHTPSLMWVAENFTSPGNLSGLSVATTPTLIAAGGTKSMRITDSGGGSYSIGEIVSMAGANGGTGITNGRIEFDYRALHDEPNQSHSFRVFDNPIRVTEMSIEGLTINLQWAGAALRLRHSGSVNLIIQNPYVVATDYHIKIDFDTDAQTQTIEVTNSAPIDPLSFGPETVPFFSTTPTGPIRCIAFATSSFEPDIMVDNIKVYDMTLPITRAQTWTFYE